MAQLRTGDEGARRFKIGEGNQDPHGQRDPQRMTKVGEGAQRIESGMEGSDLVTHRFTQLARGHPEGLLSKAATALPERRTARRKAPPAMVVARAV